jgi:hypothetical protein
MLNYYQHTILSISEERREGKGGCVKVVSEVGMLLVQCHCHLPIPIHPRRYHNRINRSESSPMKYKSNRGLVAGLRMNRLQL